MSSNSTVDFRDRVVDVLSGAFRQPHIDTDEGWHGRLHVRIVSPDFDGQSEREKQRRVWDVLRGQLDAEAQNVALVLAYGEDEAADEVEEGFVLPAD